MLTSRILDEASAPSLFFKCENFQRMGAFKFRGAFNALSLLDEAARARGVIAFSSGNHAQAVALAARLLGVKATIVMPHDAPAAKLEATVGYGGRVVTYDRYRESREAIAQRLAEESGGAVIPPYDHPDVIAGQGTAAAELIAECGSARQPVRAAGGRGPARRLAARRTGACCPRAGCTASSPRPGNDGQQSLRQGSIVRIDVPRTIADGAQTQSLGRSTFEIIRRSVARTSLPRATRSSSSACAFSPSA